MRKMKIAGVEAELDKVADESQEIKSGEVTSLQIEAAARIATEANEYPDDLVAQLDRLCLEYDAIRRSMQPGSGRTHAMTRVVVRMRALAPALVGHVETYKSSGSAGSRLAAIAMMQMNPNAADISWLGDRFAKEAPFVFYHAALALQNLATDGLSNVEWDQLLGAAQRGLDTVKAFGGVPDQSTIDVLDNLISSIR